jgi:hypothetical protein
MSKNKELNPNIIAVCKLDNISYMVLAKDGYKDGKPFYKVHVYNSETGGYGWTQYGMSFENALKHFSQRVMNNIIEHELHNELEPLGLVFPKS